MMYTPATIFEWLMIADYDDTPDDFIRFINDLPLLAAIMTEDLDPDHREFWPYLPFNGEWHLLKAHRLEAYYRKFRFVPGYERCSITLEMELEAESLGIHLWNDPVAAWFRERHEIPSRGTAEEHLALGRRLGVISV